MNDQAIHWMLLVVGVLGSVAAYTTIHRVLAPPVDDEDDLTKLAKNEVGTTTEAAIASGRGCPTNTVPAAPAASPAPASTAESPT